MWLTRLKSNRKVNPDRAGLRAVNEVEIRESGRVVWLEGYGLIRVFKIVATDGDVELWATNKVAMQDLERVKWAGFAWTIENYHRGLKQFCLIERAQVRSRRAWRNHIGMALRAFLRLESHSLPLCSQSAQATVFPFLYLENQDERRRLIAHPLQSQLCQQRDYQLLPPSNLFLDSAEAPFQARSNP
jgi:hypothetical protein